MPGRKKQSPPKSRQNAAVEAETPTITGDNAAERAAPNKAERQAKAQATLELVVDRLCQAIDIGQLDVSKLNGTTIDILRDAAQGKFVPSKQAVREMSRPGSQLDTLLSGAHAPKVEAELPISNNDTVAPPAKPSAVLSMPVTAHNPRLQP